MKTSKFRLPFPPQDVSSKYVNLNNKLYESALIEYAGDIQLLLENKNYAIAIPITSLYAVIFVESGKLPQLIQETPEIIYVEPQSTFNLIEISPFITSNIIKFNEGELIDLRGSGILVGIIDSGIDYLNKEFTTEDGKTRIFRLWDQTSNFKNPPQDLKIGSDYTNEDINKALEAYGRGEDPYLIVPEKDEVGHGTEMAGIIGARGIGEVRGAAPDCEFAIVKTRPLDKSFNEFYGIDPQIPLYEDVFVSLAIKYLVNIQKQLNKPLVILLPFGSNAGGHDGSSAIERLIDFFSFSSRLCFITGTGNEAQASTHASGKLISSGSQDSVEFQVGENQKYLQLLCWCTYSDKISIGLISPSGQVIPRLPVKINQKTNVNFLFEKSKASISYFYPENKTGDELINIEIFDAASGIWTLILYGDYISNGIYNVWMSTKIFLRPETRFLSPTDLITLTIPSTSKSIVSTAYYNQSTNAIGEFSGLGFTRDGRIKPEIASGGESVLTTAVGGGTTTITGSSAAAAVLTGAVALIFQWGIVEGNDPLMNHNTITTYLIRGATQRPNEVYPNPSWGYGTLDLLGVFESLRTIANDYFRYNPCYYDTCYMRNVTTFIPTDIYRRLF